MTIVFLFKGGKGELTSVQKFRMSEALSGYSSEEREKVIILHSKDMLRNKTEAGLILEKVLIHRPDLIFARLQAPLREVLFERNVLFSFPHDLSQCTCCKIFEEVNGIKIEDKREVFSFLGWKPTFTLWYK